MVNGVANNYGVNQYSNVYPTNNAAEVTGANAVAASAAQTEAEKNSEASGAAVSIVKSTTSKYQADFEKIKSLYAEQKNYMQGLQSITNQLQYQSSGIVLLNSLPQGDENQISVTLPQPMSGRTNLYDAAKMNRIEDFAGMRDYFSLFTQNKDGTFSVDLSGIEPADKEKLIAKAQEDVSEDGYFGVKQTSERILEFAKAITGGDPAKMENMKKVVEKAFEKVGSIFGGYDNLPDISKQTYEAVMKGFDEWAASMGVGAQAQLPA